MKERALILGGGGSLGNAWLIGVIAGLYEAGMDVTGADVIIGTSAGATAAAQIASANPAELFAATVATVPPPQKPAPDTSVGQPVRPTTAVDPLERTNRIIAASKDAADMRRRLGAAALELASESDGSERWRATVAARLPRPHWPEQALFITAVNASTGEPVVFDRYSGVDLVDAVAASCASGFAYGIGDQRYIDGGYRSNADNADLAARYARVLVLSPFGGRSRTPVEWGTHLATQIGALRAGGSHVETIFPDSDSLAAFGDNMMDFSRRPLAAQAGYNQGRALAGQFIAFWR